MLSGARVGVTYRQPTPWVASICRLSWQQLSTRKAQLRTAPCSAQSSSASRDEPLGDNKPVENRDTPKLNTTEALVKSLGEISNAEGRVANSTNLILGGDDSEEKWRQLDEQVNEYPGQRTFTAIGSGGDDFIQSMVTATASVVGTVHEECVQHRLSAKGNYVSVKVGPVWVENTDQVVAVYAAMRQDSRLRWYL